MRAGVALGSNLGDRLAHLQSARELLVRLAQVMAPILVSSVYETEPVNCEPGAAKFLNAVIELGYNGEALELLRELRKIESHLGRPAAHARNASRTIDLDLLFFGDLTLSQPELELPHPRMPERRFVLEPLAEIHPRLVLPGQTKNVSELLAQLPAQSPLPRVASEW